MNRLERMRAAVRGESLDRPPVSFWRHFPGEDRDGVSLATALLDFRSRYNLDFIKVMPPAVFFAEALGAKIEFPADPCETPKVAEPLIRNPSDWRSLRPPSPGSAPLRVEFSCLETLSQKAGDAPYIETVFSPFDTALKLAGEETLKRHIEEAPADLEAGLAQIARGWKSFLRGCMLRGISGIFFATHAADRGRFSAEAFARFGRPFDLEVFSGLERGQFFNVLHLHGERVDLDAAAGYPVQAINFHVGGTNPSIREALARFKGCVAAGIDENGPVAAGDPARVQQEVAKAVEEGGTRRFIVAPGCALPVRTPPENLAAARSAVELRF